jgi:hypothetical protein
MQMSKPWRIFEKSIAVLQIIIGLFIASQIIFDMYNLNEYFKFSGKDLSYSNFFIKRHFSLLEILLLIISGILLFKSNVKAWVASVVIWITFGIGSFLSISKLLEQHHDSWTNRGVLFYIIIAILFISIATLMMTSEFRKKYHPNSKHWLAIVIIVIIITMDRLLIS